MDSSVRTQFVGEVVSLFSSHFGKVTAEMYKDFYKDKDIETIYSSAESLLAEFLGSAKSQLILTDIRSKYPVIQIRKGSI